MCLIGSKVCLPSAFAVPSPSLYAASAWQYSCSVSPMTIPGREYNVSIMSKCIRSIVLHFYGAGNARRMYVRTDMHVQDVAYRADTLLKSCCGSAADPGTAVILRNIIFGNAVPAAPCRRRKRKYHISLISVPFANRNIILYRCIKKNNFLYSISNFLYTDSILLVFNLLYYNKLHLKNNY